MRAARLVLAALTVLPGGLRAWPPAARADEAPPPTTALPAPARSEPPGRATPLTVLEGRVRAVDLVGHALVLEVSGAPVSLALDRNTLVYLPTGLSTVYALHPGDAVRAGRNDRGLAYWVELRETPQATPSAVTTPGQGTGPGGGSPPPPERPAPATPPGGTGATVP